MTGRIQLILTAIQMKLVGNQLNCGGKLLVLEPGERQTGVNSP